MAGKDEAAAAGAINRVEVSRLIVRDQLVDLEDRVIELQNEASRLLSMAAAREAYTAALRRPRLVPTPGALSLMGATAVPPVRPIDEIGDPFSQASGEKFFSVDVGHEPARAWLLGAE